MVYLGRIDRIRRAFPGLPYQAYLLPGSMPEALRLS
jgi:hypothetical protein